MLNNPKYLLNSLYLLEDVKNIHYSSRLESTKYFSDLISLLINGKTK